MNRSTVRHWAPALAFGAVAILGLGGVAVAKDKDDKKMPEVRSASPEQDLLRQYLFQGDQYRDSGLPDKAVEQYEKALAIDDKNTDIYPRLGYALVKTGNFERAVKVYERYAELEPKNCTARSSVGFAFLSQKLVDQAVKAYEEALKLCPEEPTAYSNLGIAYEQANYPLEAIEAYRHAIELDPADVSNYDRLAKLAYDRKMYPEAASLYETILARPDNGKDEAWTTWAHGRLAFIYRWANDCADAIPHWEAVVASTGADKDTKGRALRGLAACYEETGQSAKALELYRALIAESPEESAFYYRLGDLLNDAGKNDEAIELTKQGIARDTGCAAHGYCVVGRAYEKLGGVANYKRAEREFRKALNCGDARFTDYARKQVERQQQLAKSAEAQQQRENAGY